MKSVEELIEEIEELLDNARPVPMSGGRCMINIEEMRAITEDMRSALPQEIRKAQSIVKNRSEILNDARKEAEAIIRKAEERARQMVNQEDIVRQATMLAAEKEAKARANSREIRKGARDFAEACLRRTEDYMSQRLGELRRARQNLHASQKAADEAADYTDDDNDFIDSED